MQQGFSTVRVHLGQGDVDRSGSADRSAHSTQPLKTRSSKPVQRLLQQRIPFWWTTTSQPAHCRQLVLWRPTGWMPPNTLLVVKFRSGLLTSARSAWNVSRSALIPHCRTAQDISTALRSVRNYVTDEAAKALEAHVIPSARTCAKMKESSREKAPLFAAGHADYKAAEGDSDHCRAMGTSTHRQMPWAYEMTKGVFELLEKKRCGGLFSIVVDDLCKGCAACVDARGDHEALVMPKSLKKSTQICDQQGFLNSCQTRRRNISAFDATPAESL